MNTSNTMTISGKAYVVGDNIDTDQIIPAQYLSLVPTIPAEYERLGQRALCGLPRDMYPIRFVEDDATRSDYSIVIAGRNFGCGSSREHAPVALGAAGIKVVVAQSFARIFFRNTIATGEFYPVECPDRLIDEIKTGDAIEVDLDTWQLRRTGRTGAHAMQPMGDAASVIRAGGLFAYARKTGLVEPAGVSK